MNQRQIVENDNGVNETVSPTNGVSVSPGRIRDGLQVTTDRHPATRSNRVITRIATWNVRTLFRAGRLDNVVQEMDRLRINVLGLSEVRWTGAGMLRRENCTVIYSGGQKHEKGVAVILDKHTSKCTLGYWALSDRVILVKLKGNPFNVSIIQVYAPTSDADDEEVEKFYETVDEAYCQCKSADIKILMGDLNAKVGADRDGKIVGPFGLGVRNERGNRFVDWCNRNGQVITNTWFKHHPRRLYTWISPGDRVRNQIDFITINERFRNSVFNSKTYPGADCNSDHNPVVLTMKLRLKNEKKSNRKKQLEYKELKNDNTRCEFKRRSTERLDLSTPKAELWHVVRDALKEAAEMSLPEKKKLKFGKNWMTEEILKLMERRRLLKNRNEVQYIELCREIRRKCNKAKEAWLNKECEEMERKGCTNLNEIFDKVRKLTGKRSNNRSGCIRSETGVMLTEPRGICGRWERYITELFHDNRGEPPHIEANIDGPEITKDEIRNAIRKMKKGKALGPDDVPVELFEAMGEEGIKLLHTILNHAYDTGELPDDFLRSVFIALPKKPGATECKDHRTISIMSHSVKLLLTIILERVRTKLRPEIADEQFGFMPDKGTRNAIFTLRMLCERAIQHQQVVFLCFIDYVKAFDKVQHEKLLKLLQELSIDGKDIQLIRNLYWNQEAAIRVEDILSAWIQISRGLRQGCVQSPDFFNLYSEMILRTIIDMVGLKVGGVNFNNLRYADDTVLIATTEEQLQALLDQVVEASAEMGLTINCDKTKSMVVSKLAEKPHCYLRIGNDHIEEKESFNYLGSLLTTDVRCKKEVKKRIAVAKLKFQDLRSIFVNRNLSMPLKIRLLKCYIWSILTYGCEAWTLTADLEKNLEAAEMWFLRRMLKVSFIDHVSNEEVMRRAGVKRELLSVIIERQLRFLGHVVRKEGLECVALQGKIEGKRARGRQRITYLDRVKKVTGIANTAEIFACARNRQRWRDMVAQACIMHGT